MNGLERRGGAEAGEAAPAEPASGRRAASAREVAYYGEDVAVHAPSGIEELRDLVRFAETERRRIVPAGLGAHAGIADPPPAGALVVSACRFDAVAQYEPDDFTIGVGAGMPLASFRAALDEHRQELAVDLGRAARGTVGGLVARAPFGPRSAHSGKLSALLLGVEGMRGGGKLFRSGGMVVKNVAGYQIGKFLAGAHGAGAILLRLNFKLRSRPSTRHARLASFASSPQALAFAAELRRARLEPAVLAVLSGAAVDDVRELGSPGRPGDWIVVWVFEGIEPRVAWLAKEAQRMAHRAQANLSESLDGAAATRMLDYLTEFADAGPEPREDLGIVRVVVLPAALGQFEMRLRTAVWDREGIVAGFLADASSGSLVIRWTAETSRVMEPLEEIRAAALAHGGRATLLHLPASRRERCTRILTKDPSAVLTARILDVFDPARVFGGRK